MTVVLAVIEAGSLRTMPCLQISVLGRTVYGCAKARMLLVEVLETQTQERGKGCEPRPSLRWRER